MESGNLQLQPGRDRRLVRPSSDLASFLRLVLETCLDWSKILHFEAITRLRHRKFLHIDNSSRRRDI